MLLIQPVSQGVVQDSHGSVMWNEFTKTINETGASLDKCNIYRSYCKTIYLPLYSQPFAQARHVTAASIIMHK